MRHVAIGAFGIAWAAALALILLQAPESELRLVSANQPEQRAAAAPAVPTPIDDPAAYQPLPKPRPTLVESEAGIPAQQVAEEQEPSTDGGGAKPPSEDEIRAELRLLRRYYSSLPSQYSPDANSAPFELTAGDLSLLSGWQTSVSSVYFDYGGPLACGGRLRRDQFGVANKSLPCGTMVTFRYGGRALRVPVIDRGPYIKGREWDLTGATAIALRFPGLGPIEWTLDG